MSNKAVAPRANSTLSTSVVVGRTMVRPVTVMWPLMSQDTVRWSSTQQPQLGAGPRPQGWATVLLTTLPLITRKSTETTLLTFLMVHTTTIVPQAMLSIWRNRWALVTLIATLRLRNLCSCCRTQFGRHMVTRPNKGMAGLGTLEHGSLMLVGWQVDSTSIRSVVSMQALHQTSIKWESYRLIRSWGYMQNIQ